jgi:hypothetical protein
VVLPAFNDLKEQLDYQGARAFAQALPLFGNSWINKVEGLLGQK